MVVVVRRDPAHVTAHWVVFGMHTIAMAASSTTLVADKEECADYFLFAVTFLPVRIASVEGPRGDDGIMWVPSQAVVSTILPPDEDDSDHADGEEMSLSHHAIAKKELRLQAQRMRAAPRESDGGWDSFDDDGFQVFDKDTRVRTAVWVQPESEAGVGAHVNFGGQLTWLPVFGVRAPALEPSS